MTLALLFIFISLLLVEALNFLPVGHLPPEAFSYLATVIGTAKSWEFLIPLSTAFQIFTLLLTYEAIKYFWKFIKFLLKLFRGGTS